MPSYEVVEHSVESDEPNRHWLRVAVYRGERKKATLPDVWAEFLLHAPEEDPVAFMVDIIEQRVNQILDDEEITQDEFGSKQLSEFNLRRAYKKNPVEMLVAQQVKGRKVDVVR